MSDNQRFKGMLLATDSTPRPGEFAIGSAQSRAAARALLQRKNSPRPPANTPPGKIADFVVTTIGKRDEPIRIGEWWNNPDGTWMRFSRLPYGITIEQAERMVADGV